MGVDALPPAVRENAVGSWGPKMDPRAPRSQERAPETRNRTPCPCGMHAETRKTVSTRDGESRAVEGGKARPGGILKRPGGGDTPRRMREHDHTRGHRPWPGRGRRRRRRRRFPPIKGQPRRPSCLRGRRGPRALARDSTTRVGSPPCPPRNPITSHAAPTAIGANWHGSRGSSSGLMAAGAACVAVGAGRMEMGHVRRRE